MKWIPSARSNKLRNRALGLKPCHPIGERRGKGWAKRQESASRLNKRHAAKPDRYIKIRLQKKHDGRKPKAVK